MGFRVDDLPAPEHRTAADWVVYYLRLEDAVSQGETVSVNGRSVSLPDLQTIRATRKDWERQIGQPNAAEQAARAGGRYAPIYLGGS